MPTFAIVLPFADYTDEVRASLAALARTGDLERFELILVRNAPDPPGPEVVAEIGRILEGSAYRLLHYPERIGPSQAWCYGLRRAAAEYACFLAVDAPVAASWAGAVFAAVDGSADLYQGDYSAASGDRLCDRLESAIDRVRFEGLGAIDFRNAILRRSSAVRLLDEHFAGLFASDVEIDLLRPRLAGFTVRAIPGARVVNLYPATLRACARRKFRHGVCVGRILRHRPAGMGRGPKGAGFRFAARTWSMARGMRTRLALAAMHGIFFTGAVLGWLLPAGFARRYYTMHFDDQENDRKISAG